MSPGAAARSRFARERLVAEVEGQRGRGRAAGDPDAVVVAALAGRAVAVAGAVFRQVAGPARPPWRRSRCLARRSKRSSSTGVPMMPPSVPASRRRRPSDPSNRSRISARPHSFWATGSQAIVPGIGRRGSAGPSPPSVRAHGACPPTSRRGSATTAARACARARSPIATPLYRGRSQEWRRGDSASPLLERAAARMGLFWRRRVATSRCDAGRSVKLPSVLTGIRSLLVASWWVVAGRAPQKNSGRRRGSLTMVDTGTSDGPRGRARVRRRGRPSRGRLDEPAADESVHAGPGPERAPDDCRRKRARSGRRGHDR